MSYSGRARNASSACMIGCQLHAKSKKIITLLHRQLLRGWALRISLEISFSSTVGAGGFSISPKLDFRAVVPVNSEVFSVLYDAEKSFRTQDVYALILETQEALFKAFREGKASKSDALQSGDTILHVSVTFPITVAFNFYPS
ncbi:hypothetical protein N7462_005741 [Penicillium macrosclerotiorum]|uniref:uncharacterized protein n=1 Tax=Penicillium macrosclerotiorum TaxID=303699 RepID=UPI0025490A49|nr:uncharacterized protein N7462_005741 [Penicillium macrosclerotiorum]KAJ5682576.1 hypothetical protein N7462_005741 [Penicillium macrosclerotiorum]